MPELRALTPLGASSAKAFVTVGRADVVLMRELPLHGALDLRLDARDHAAMSAVASAIGAALPVTPNTWIAAPGAHALWQAYDEWLLVTPDGKQAALASTLRRSLADWHFALTDMSDLRAAFELTGPRARDVLQKGCAVDLHPRAFGAGTCVQTALARVRVTLRQMDATPVYQALVDRSYARYLWDWLLDAALEYVQLRPPPSQPRMPIRGVASIPPEGEGETSPPSAYLAP